MATSVSGVYTIVDPPRVLAFTWQHDWKPDAVRDETLVRYDLSESNGVTTVRRLTHARHHAPRADRRSGGTRLRADDGCRRSQLVDARRRSRHSAFRPEWNGTTLAFDLRAEAATTVLSFAHRGFARADETYALTTTGWGLYLVSLQLYLETGAGTPRASTSPAASR